MSDKRSLMLADLLAHGLIRASFAPNAQTQEQRGLLRTRKQLTRERTSHVQRLQKTLEEPTSSSIPSSRTFSARAGGR